MIVLMKKERIAGFDFIRAMSCLLIVFYHTIRLFESIPAWNHFPVKSAFVNGDWGHISVVAVFFMLSGTALLHNYPILTFRDLKTFYLKRAKSIFPAFYLVWAYFYITTALKVGNFLFMGYPQWFIPTVFGVDGYFLYLHPNYYMVGEWFLGAIILLYLLYPLLLFLWNKCWWLFSIVMTAVFLLVIRFNPFQIDLSDNLFVCMFSFWCGFLYLKFREKLQKKWFLPVLLFIAAIALFVIPLNTNQVLVMVFVGILSFPFLDLLGGYLLKVPLVGRFLTHTGTLSYEIFLVHHQLIFSAGALMMNYLNENFSAGAQWVFAILLIPASLFFAKAVQLMTAYFLSWGKKQK